MSNFQTGFVIKGLPSMGTLVDLRKAAGISGVEMAKRMGVSQPRFVEIEKLNTETMELDTVRRYVKALGGTLLVTSEELRSHPPLTTAEMHRGKSVYVSRQKVGNIHLMWFGGSLFEIHLDGEVLDAFELRFPPATVEDAKREARDWWVGYGGRMTRDIIKAMGGRNVSAPS